MPTVAYPVAVPCGVTQGDWVQYVTACMLTDLALIADCLKSVCSPILCNHLESSKARYQWVEEDGSQAKLSSAAYTANVLKYGERVINEDENFQSRNDNVLRLYRRIYRVYAHALSCHHSQLKIYGFYTPLTSYYSSFLDFATHHGLLSQFEVSAGGTNI
jgi:MOB kinase activator 1